MDDIQDSCLTLAADLVAAYVSHNSLPASELPSLIGQLHATLRGLATGKAVAAAQDVELRPAVPIKKSVTEDYIICLEDGRKLKSLKRHLNASFNLTPEQYRAKWGLPADYPMVAPAYARQRSELARAIGLGQIGRNAKPAEAAAASTEASAPAETSAKAPRKTGGKAKGGSAMTDAAASAPVETPKGAKGRKAQNAAPAAESAPEAAPVRAAARSGRRDAAKRSA